jgi:hypothetical protein
VPEPERVQGAAVQLRREVRGELVGAAREGECGVLVAVQAGEEGGLVQRDRQVLGRYIGPPGGVRQEIAGVRQDPAPQAAPVQRRDEQRLAVVVVLGGVVDGGEEVVVLQAEPGDHLGIGDESLHQRCGDGAERPQEALGSHVPLAALDQSLARVGPHGLQLAEPGTSRRTRHRRQQRLRLHARDQLDHRQAEVRGDRPGQLDVEPARQHC